MRCFITLFCSLLFAGYTLVSQACYFQLNVTNNLHRPIHIALKDFNNVKEFKRYPGADVATGSTEAFEYHYFAALRDPELWLKITSPGIPESEVNGEIHLVGHTVRRTIEPTDLRGCCTDAGNAFIIERKGTQRVTQFPVKLEATVCNDNVAVYSLTMNK